MENASARVNILTSLPMRSATPFYVRHSCGVRAAVVRLTNQAKKESWKKGRPREQRTGVVSKIKREKKGQEGLFGMRRSTMQSDDALPVPIEKR